MTVIMVTHERPLAERFASRIATLSDGRLVSDGVRQ
jgi:ABC-type methionine transport system ATPase subunit